MTCDAVMRRKRFILVSQKTANVQHKSLQGNPMRRKVQPV